MCIATYSDEQWLSMQYANKMREELIRELSREDLTQEEEVRLLKRLQEVGPHKNLRWMPERLKRA